MKKHLTLACLLASGSLLAIPPKDNPQSRNRYAHSADRIETSVNRMMLPRTGQQRLIPPTLSLKKNNGLNLTNKVKPSSMMPGNLCGYLINSSDNTHEYEIDGWTNLNPTTGVMENLWTDNFCMSGSPLQTVFVRDGRLCGYNIFWFFGEIYGISYVELDLATGETLVNEDFSDTDKLFLSVAYVPASDEIYGFMYSS